MGKEILTTKGALHQMLLEYDELVDAVVLMNETLKDVWPGYQESALRRKVEPILAKHLETEGKQQ